MLLIASIGVLNLMLMAVFERTREMGVLAALGMKGRQVMWLFLLEGALIWVVGAIMGCAIGYGIVLTLSQVGIDFRLRPVWANNCVDGLADLSQLTRSMWSYGVAVVLDRRLCFVLSSLACIAQGSRRRPCTIFKSKRRCLMAFGKLWQSPSRPWAQPPPVVLYAAWQSPWGWRCLSLSTA